MIELTLSYLVKKIIINNERKKDNMGLFDIFKKNKSNLDSERINKIAEEGNELYKCGDLDNALKKYFEGYNLIPNPKNIYSESSWFEVAIGDIFFDNKNFKEALEYYEKSKNNITGNGINNPYILFKYGASAFELGRNSLANEFLLRAYMLSGDDIFNDYDKKYFEFIKQNNKDIK